LGEAASASGNQGVLRGVTPTSPDGMDVHSLSNIDDQLDVGVVVVIRATGDLQESNCLASRPRSVYRTINPKSVHTSTY
jgi:hypothetical protein